MATVAVKGLKYTPGWQFSK